MRIDTANHGVESDWQRPTPALFVDEPGALRVISIEPDDDIEHVLMALPQPPVPIIFLLPEQSQAFHDPSQGTVAFASSGQLDPSSAKGLNVIVSLSLSHLSTPAAGQSYVAWIMPNQSDDAIKPLFLDMLSLIEGKIQLTYVHPNHDNLLARYSAFEIDVQNDDRLSVLPSLDGTAYASSSGDIIPGSLLLVDPYAGRFGLLEASPNLPLLPYLTYVDIHLQRLIVLTQTFYNEGR